MKIIRTRSGKRTDICNTDRVGFCAPANLPRNRPSSICYTPSYSVPLMHDPAKTPASSPAPVQRVPMAWHETRCEQENVNQIKSLFYVKYAQEFRERCVA